MSEGGTAVVSRGYHFKSYNSFDESINLYAIFFEMLDLIEDQLQEVNVSHKFDTIRIDVTWKCNSPQ